MSREILEAIRGLAQEKGIDAEILKAALEDALLSAYKKSPGSAKYARVEFDDDTGDYRVYELILPAELEEKLLAQAVEEQEQEIDPETGELREPEEPELDPEVLRPYEDQIQSRDVTPDDFGRIAAQTAKQVMLQRIREAERQMMYDEYQDRVGELITGIIQQSDNRYTLVQLRERVEALLPRSEQVFNERYDHGMRVKAVITDVSAEGKGPSIVVSRRSPELIKELFELEVPEIADDLVEIVGVAREPGYRSKIAVISHADGVDPVGACVGPRGSRVRMVVSELRGEKIDIIPHNDEPARFVAKALSPARVREVLVDDETKEATVIVPDDQLSLAIGREGQNARLAAKLTGWKVDIKSQTEFSQEDEIEYEQGEEADGRCAAVLSAGRRCPNAALDGSRYCGLPQHQALARFATNQVTVLAGLGDDEVALLADPDSDEADVAALVARAESEHSEAEAVTEPAEELARAPRRPRRSSPPRRPRRGRPLPTARTPRRPRKSRRRNRPTARTPRRPISPSRPRATAPPSRPISLSRPRRPPRSRRRLRASLARKRVHEIAKARGLTSKEVLAALNAAGIEAKAAASSVEEADAARALEAANGGGAPATKEPAATPGPKQAAASAPKQAVRPVKPAGDGSSGATGGAKKRRRVVIDSGASRRDQPQAPPRRPPRRRGGRRRRPLLEEPPAAPQVEEEQPPLKVPSGATVREVAEIFGVGSADVIKQLMTLGEMATLTQSLSDETVEVLAGALDRKVEMVSAAEEVSEAPVYDDDPEDLADRPPVVTIMGHVDHGKTSLLDAIRETEVVAGEAGGITQHIGAYQVHQNGKTISFIDTPGHAAFTAMRARGADVTDIVVIVVAADDGVMPQTVEAIDHAKAAEVPIMVAINKIDLPDANPDRVKGELATQGLNPEDWGGETIFVNVSAKTKENLDELLENIILLAEVEELQANPDAPASGTVIESHLDPGRGPVATVLVQRGTLNVGDSLAAGAQWGKVRAMQDHTGARLDHARPGDPVEVLGFEGVCEAGERVEVVENDRRARQLAQERAQRLKSEQLARRQARRLSLDEVFAKAKEGEINELNIVLKADVSGSLEALQDEIAKLPQDEIVVNVIRAGAGGINESDVMLAAASDAVIIGFNVRPLLDARRAGEREGVEIRTYSVIYKVTEDLRAAMEGMLVPEEVEQTLGQAEVLELFKASRIGTIAGCSVTDGKISRGGEVRLVRDGTVVWTGRIGSLRRFKDDVSEVDAGLECGVVLEGFQDVKVGDVLEVFETRQVEKTLE